MPRITPSRAFAAAILVLAFLAAACGAPAAEAPPGGATGPEKGGREATGPSATDPGDRSPNAESGPDAAPVPDLLDFEAPLVGGGVLRGAELAGAPVAVWFWAPW